jgi:predicted ester cyclase
MMSAEIRALLERYLDAWNKGDLDAVDETCSTGFLFQQPGMPDAAGIAAHRGYVQAFQAALPDVQITLDQLICEGEHYAARYTLIGTHAGSSPVLPGVPSGNRIEVTAGEFGRVVDGKFC